MEATGGVDSKENSTRKQVCGKHPGTVAGLTRPPQACAVQSLSHTSHRPAQNKNEAKTHSHHPKNDGAHFWKQRTLSTKQKTQKKSAS